MKKLLVVVDFQNDFVCGSLGFEGADALDSRIAERIAAARRDGFELAFTLDTHADDYLATQEGRLLPVPHCVINTDGHKIFGKTREHMSGADAVFCKPTFGSAELFDYIRRGEYEVIELCGLVTNICVLANAVLAKTAAPEAKIVVNAALVDSFDRELHQKTLDVLRGIQVEVIE